MYIQHLKLKNFRNYQETQIELSKETNILIGNNGQGKTNLLEAAYILSVARSFRTTKDKEMIEFGHENCQVTGTIISNQRQYKIQIRIGKEIKKAIKINEIPITNLSELLGILNVVIFSPEDLNLIKGSPKERRRFLDREISQIKPSYYNLLRDYNKILQQKNTHLKQGKIEQTLLDVYDESLSTIGHKISTIRNDFINKISKISKQYHKEISSNQEELTITYQKNIKSTTQQDYQNVLKTARNEDIQRGITTKGIHRDDLNLKINNIELRDYGSQGQQRSAAIAMKLSEIEIIKNEKGQYPVVILDDIFSELDQNRQQNLLKTIGKAQTFISTAEQLPFHIKYKKIDIKNGKIINQEEQKK